MAKFIKANSQNFRVGRTQKVKYIVIHYTANNGDTAEGNAHYFQNNIVKASAHFFADENGTIQSVSEDDTAYHVGANKYVHPTCRNANSIGIEMCSRKDNKGKYYIEDETIKNAINTTKYLMKKYNVPLANILRHYDVTGKICPAPFVKDPTQWHNFKLALAK